MAEDTALLNSAEDIFGASDEDFMKMPAELPDAEADENTDTENDSDESDDGDTSNDSDTDEDTDDEDDQEATEDEDEENEDSKDEDDSEETDDSEDAEGGSDESDTDVDDNSDDDDNSEDTDDKDNQADEDDKSEDALDYKAEYEKLLAPFKANGTTMQVQSVDEAVTLMQMGANYHKKMAGLKPSLKVVKLLERHELLDLDKINYLIDLHSKKPEAITKLLKDSNVNPIDIDLEATNDYTPEQREVTDSEVDLDNVLDDLKGSPTYTKTLNVITEQWDEASRGIIAQNPNIIALLDMHMGSGDYDAIATVVNRERSLGRLNGTSDLEAYKQVGDILYNNKQLPTQQLSQKPPKKTPSKKQNAAKEKIRKARKKAVKLTKTSKSTTTKPLGKINPLAMSDEEFNKIADQEF